MELAHLGLDEGLRSSAVGEIFGRRERGEGDSEAAIDLAGIGRLGFGEEGMRSRSWISRDKERREEEGGNGRHAATFDVPLPPALSLSFLGTLLFVFLELGRTAIPYAELPITCKTRD